MTWTKLKAEHEVFVRSMGKALRVTALFTEEGEANDYMARHADEGVVACFGPFILLANLYDRGADDRTPARPVGQRGM